MKISVKTILGQHEPILGFMPGWRADALKQAACGRGWRGVWLKLQCQAWPMSCYQKNSYHRPYSLAFGYYLYKPEVSGAT